MKINRQVSISESAKLHNKKIFHPLQSLMIILGSIFVLGLGVHLVMDDWSELSSDLRPVVEALLLMALMFPLIYLLSFKNLHTLQRRLNSSEASFKAVFIDSIDGILAVDKQGQIKYANETAVSLLGKPLADLVGMDFGQPTIRGNAMTQIEVPQRDGSFSTVELQCITSTWEDEDAFLVLLHDVTSNVRQNEALREQVMVDELTRLKNRRGFFLLGEQLMKQVGRGGKLHVYFIDLDDMKNINDQYGHAEGDRALTDTADILSHIFRGSDIIARIGGDEFSVTAIVAEDEDVTDLGERLQKHVALYNQQHTRPYKLSLSHGMSCYDPDKPLSLEQLLVMADAAMYRNKTSRKKKKNYGQDYLIEY